MEHGLLSTSSSIVRMLDQSPLRRNILVADACERICPPIGLSAPPATKVIVAPGSAEVTQVSMESEQKDRGITLNLIREEDRDLKGQYVA
jgi:hypothetical protein